MVSFRTRYPGNTIHWTCVIHPKVVMGTGNKFGPYCVIGEPAEWKGFENEGNVVIGNNNTFTGMITIDSGGQSNTLIENNCYIMKHAHVGHDAIIWADTTLSCGSKVGGHSIIGTGCNIGLNAVIHQNQKIAEGCMIGMGAVVTKKLITEPYKIYAGNPAKLIGENTKHPNYESSRHPA